MNAHFDLLDELHLQDFQKRTVRHVHARMIEGGQRRFLVADEVGLGKTKVAQGVIAMSTGDEEQANILYIASSQHIVGQNLRKLRTSRLEPEHVGSLCLLALRVYQGDIQGKLIGLTPIKDLRSDHFGSIQERGLLYRLLTRRYRNLMLEADIRRFFQGNRANDAAFDRVTTGSVPGELRDHFEMALDPEIITRLKDPLLRKKHARAIVGALRATLAKCALTRLNPALIIIDEIQRFSNDLLTLSPSPQVRYLLDRPLVVLSATPYQPGTPQDHSGKEPHKGFIELVRFLNPDEPQKVRKVENALSTMRSALMKPVIQRAELSRAVDDLGNQLRDFMVRTERPFDAHVERVEVEATLSARDLTALRQSMQLLKKTKPTAKNKRHRFAELVELWKSTPYVVSALSRKYVTGRDFSEARGRLPAPAALTSTQLYKKAILDEPVHPRLRAMIGRMGSDASARRLWLPPTLPYIDNPSRSAAGPPSKTLVFTSWGAAPPAIATALNLHVEPRPGRAKDLEFSRKSKTGKLGQPVRSVHAIGAPLWKFAESSDPFSAMRLSGRTLSPSALIAQIRHQLIAAGNIRVSRKARHQSLAELALALNANPTYPGAEYLSPSYLNSARDLMAGIAAANDNMVTLATANDLAELAAAAPGTCAYRALRRTISGLDQDRCALFSAALDIGNSITRLFQRPSAVAIVESQHAHRKTPYWRKVLRFCLENDLQSVLDEYVFLLVRDSSKQNAGELAEEIAQAIHIALATVGGLQVARPKPKANSPYGVTMYARALGESDSSMDEDSPGARDSGRKGRRPIRGKGPHVNPLLAAFNSPFPPFVLATTSTGQEGLDMHRYCRRLVHWNLPSSPLALEQREGRVDRYLSLGVRTNIAKLKLPPSRPSTDGSAGNPWELLIQEARNNTDQHKSILAPLWHFGEGQPIEAIAINISFSKEETAWQRLLEEASWYRLVLGQPDPHALLERLANGSDDNRREIDGIRLNLAPRNQRQAHDGGPMA